MRGLGRRGRCTCRRTSSALAPGRTAEVRVGETRVGVVGQVHPDVAAAFEIEQDVFLFEIVLDDLLPLVSGAQRKAVSVSRFPAVEQDLALIVDSDTAAGALQAVIEAIVARARRARVRRVRRRPGAGRQEVAWRSPSRTSPTTTR